MLANSVMYLFRKQKFLILTFWAYNHRCIISWIVNSLILTLACQRQQRGREEGLSGRREADPAPAENAGQARSHSFNTRMRDRKTRGVREGRDKRERKREQAESRKRERVQEP